MRRRRNLIRGLTLSALAALGLYACTPAKDDFKAAKAEWTIAGGDGAGRYYSALEKINAGNVGSLGYAWSYTLPDVRGQEATPLVVGGTMYTSSIFGHVYALNAKTGELLWHYDPQIDGQRGRYPCCDSVNRGVAYRDGVVFVVSVDGRMHAIEAKTGKARWVVDTLADKNPLTTSTGAPVLTGDSVIIGNSGADMGEAGSRGYVSAFDIKTGAFKWRFFTLPPPVGKPYETPDQEFAAKSWGPDRTGLYQSGATVWDGMSYDPETNLIIFGTANAAPYIQTERSRSKSDDLFSASIVAVHADTGRLAWYYQETPGDEWDFDAVQKFVFATLNVGGAEHKVVMQASKNGFFYVLDRTNGKLLAADAYAYMNWAKGVDMKTGRPIFTDNVDYTKTPKNIYPSWAGAHTWNPMSFSPRTGLVYIPSVDASNVFLALKANGGTLSHLEGFFSTNGIDTDDSYDPKSYLRQFGKIPDLETLKKERPGVPMTREILKAWDPVKRKVVWEKVTSTQNRGYDGGVLTTASNLLFQGRGDGKLYVYDARDGRLLKTVDTGSHIMAAPMTYEVDGEQYVAVQTGYGGVGIGYQVPPTSAAYTRQNNNRIIVFKLGGGPVPKPPLRPNDPFAPPPPSNATPAMIGRGEDLFVRECSRCHVLGVGVTPDLRRLPPDIHAKFNDILLKGLLKDAGMGRFDDVLSPADVEALHAYLIDQQRQGYEAQQKGGK
jgi:quinohemoprotein ethanol dehydrogenase